ncbi:MAG: asparagine synthase (glutamine-hydrolyzing) [Candidatus Omnitrophica bacterium]|nr:asparagine synthase (glutamine-hydrolyzing) [Candidatus Omnitrophota bacterium]
MCGIAGILSQRQIQESDVHAIKRMNEIQKHRGPDDEGLYAGSRCVLGHKRLAIIDLSSNGHQPFISDDQRYYLVYNGEIYNYIELREELKALGWSFRTKTDTEVLLKSYQAWGADCLKKFNGMFAFVVYDSVNHSLFLARDRVGIKPLYYQLTEDRIYFASELKAFRAIDGFHPTLYPQAVFDFLVFNRTNIDDETFLTEIKRLPNGFYGLFDKDGLRLIQWWDPEKILQEKQEGSLEEIFKAVEELLISSLRLRMRSDVPVGSCLSGGVDSSILLGILFEHGMVKEGFPTFTASFPGFKKDETSYVDILNKKYPFVNYRTFPSSDKAYEELDTFTYFQDKPCTNPSFYAQYDVMRKAKEAGVTVLLDGQGGDEIFAGYHYFHGFHLCGLLKNKKYSDFISYFIRMALRKPDPEAYSTLLFKLMPASLQSALLMKRTPFIKNAFFREHLDKSIIFKKFMTAEDLNMSLVRHYQYKLEHLLHYEDRNSMAFSLEARVPYMDHRLIEYLLKVPGHFKIDIGETKRLQKMAVGKYTVQEILNRKDKTGFDTPIDEWFKDKKWQDLARDSYEDLLKDFSFVFEKKDMASFNSVLRWKLIQLAVWKRLFLN